LAREDPDGFADGQKNNRMALSCGNVPAKALRLSNRAAAILDLARNPRRQTRTTLFDCSKWEYRNQTTLNRRGQI